MFLCYLLSVPKTWGLLFSPYRLSSLFLQVHVPPPCSPLSLPCPLFGSFCHLYAFCLQMHLYLPFWWSHCSQLGKMLIDCTWLCHHSVVKYLYRVISNVHLYLGSRLTSTSCILPNAPKIYRCHKS